jgi:pantoate--beta-alanine ligase
MIIFKKQKDLHRYLSKQVGDIGFVPTMGALHKGHIALISEARKQSTTVVCSIFVNPTQFNDPKDFAKYPVTLEKDIDMLEKAGTDVLFLPSVSELYPNGTSLLESYDLGAIEKVLEGEFRPGHFQGVCQVMNRLLTAVGPHKLFMGQKDFQQCLVIARLLKLGQFSTTLITCATVRETDGLAMSSRNRRLNEEERKNALGISKALQFARDAMGKLSLQEIKMKAWEILEQHKFRIDYIEFADSKNLELVKEWDNQQSIVMLIAAFQGEVRLIDNRVLYPI